MAQTHQELPANSDPLQRILDSIHEFGLDQNLIELETRGYTTIPKVLSENQIRQAKDAIIARAEQTTKNTVDIDSETGEGYEGLTYLPYLLYDNEIFEEILLEPKPLALITYLLGESCLLSSLGCHFKGPGGAALPLHSDNGNGIPAPFLSVSPSGKCQLCANPIQPGSRRTCIGSGKSQTRSTTTARRDDARR